MIIKRIESDSAKEDITRTILESLPDWFGIPEATEEYIADSRGKPFSALMTANRLSDFSI